MVNYFVLVLVLFSTACSASVDSGGSSKTDKSASTIPAIKQGDPEGATCPLANMTQPCACELAGYEIPGRQVCDTNIGWSNCECIENTESIEGISQSSAGFLAKNKIAKVFNWHHTIPAGGTCESGTYNGTFDGIYIPAITFGFGPVPVFGNVTFELGQSTNGEYFEVQNGHMIGDALVAFPFKGEIVGTLDCSSGIFEGQLKECEYVIPGLPAFPFEGVIKAEYDRFNHAFVNGVWSVREMDGNTGKFMEPLEVSPGVPVPAPPPFGGTGTWNNSWIP